MGFWQGRKAGSIRRCPLHITAPRILQHPAQPRACLLLSHCWRLKIEKSYWKSYLQEGFHVLTQELWVQLWQLAIRMGLEASIRLLSQGFLVNTGSLITLTCCRGGAEVG